MFTVYLTAGDYGVSIGSDARDAFLISVPNTSSNYTLAQVITSRLTYTYTASPQYEQLLNKNVADGYPGLDSSWGRIPPWLLGTNAPSAGDQLYTDGDVGYWAPPGTGSGADASVGYVLTTSNTLYGVTSTASNALQTQITAAPTTSQLLAASNALTAKVDLHLLTTQFLVDSNGLQTQISALPTTALLNAASNALVSYANGVTNSSIVRQVELTAASNALVSLIGSGGGGSNFVTASFGSADFTNSPTVAGVSVATVNNLTVSSNSLYSSIIARATTVELNTSSNALKVLIDAKVGNAELLVASNVLQTQISALPTTSILNTASNALVSYANGTTNSSIVRQTELTAASNNLYSGITTLTTSVGLKANTTDLLSASNALTAKVDLKVSTVQFLSDSNALVAYANGVTNSSIVRQAELTAASNALFSAIGTGGGSNFIVSAHGTLVVTGEVSAASGVFTTDLNSQGDTTLSGSGVTGNRVLYLSAGKVVSTSPGVTPTELEYLDGVTGGIQTNLDARAATTELVSASNTLATATTANTTALGVASNSLSARVAVAVTNNNAGAVHFLSDFTVDGDTAFGGPVDVTGQLWPKAGFPSNATNVMRALSEDTAPATNDMWLTWDASANGLKQVAMNSAPVGYLTRSAIASASNSLYGLVQPLDSDLTDIAAIATAGYGINFLALSSATSARGYLGLALGTNVMAYDTELSALGGLTSAADRLPYFTGSGTAGLATFTAAGRALVDDADAATMRTTLGLVIGTDVEAKDSDLTALAGISTSGLLAHTGAGTAAARTITGTANEVAVSNGTGASGDPTISLPSTIDLGGKSSFELPNSASPTVDAFGEIAGDNNLWGVNRGGIVYYDGTSTIAAVPALASSVPSSGQVPVWNSSGYTTWQTPTGASSTNEARFAYAYKSGSSSSIARSNRLGFTTYSYTTNFGVSAGKTIFTNQLAGFYEISAGYTIDSVSNNTYAVMVSTNEVHAQNLIGYLDHRAGTISASLGSNTVAVSGVVYIPANSTISAWSDYTKNASGEVAYNFVNPYLTIRAIDVPGSASSTVYTSVNVVSNSVAGTFGSLTSSNYFGLGYTNAGSNAVQVVDMTGPPIVRSHINGDTTIVLTNMAAWTNTGFGSTVRIDARHTTGTVTIASIHPIDWGTKGFVIGSGDTNHIYISWNGAELEGRTIADRYTGSGATVLSNAPTILTPVNRYVPTVITGSGGALTNFTLLSTYPEMLIAVSTNVSIRGVMNYDTSLADYWTLVLTNRSGSDRTLEFSQVTNDWTFAGTYGTNAPNTLTNNTRLMISARQRGTNIEVGYTYFRVH